MCQCVFYFDENERQLCFSHAVKQAVKGDEITTRIGLDYRSECYLCEEDYKEKMKVPK